MDFLAKNLAVLSRHNPLAAEDLRRLPRRAWSLERRGERLAAVTPAGVTIEFNTYGKVTQTDPEISLYVVKGAGDGSLARGVLSATGCRHVLWYEPSPELFLSLLAARDESSWLSDERLRVMTGSDAGTLSNGLDAYFHEDPFRLTCVCHHAPLLHGGTEKIPGQAEAYTAFDRLFSARASCFIEELKPNEEDAFWGFLDFLDNYPEYADFPTLSGFEGLFRGRPGVIVASGPSLGGAMEHLRSHASRAVVFASDSAFKTLFHAGIRPDLAGSLERVGTTRRFFEGVSAGGETALIAPSVVCRSTIDAFAGPKISVFFNTGFEPWFFDDLALDVPGPSCSITHLGYIALRKLGCDPILLFGQDLAFDPVTDASHEEGIDPLIKETEDLRREVTGKPAEILVATGYDGGPRRTKRFWRHFADLYAPLIRRYGGRAIHAIPVTHGIPIPGTERMDPEDALKRFASEAFDKTALAVRLGSRRPDSARRGLFAAKAMHWRETLSRWRDESLATMRSLGEMWRDHDTRAREHQEPYRDFFASLEKKLDVLRKESEWDGQFVNLVFNSFLNRRVERQMIRYGGEADRDKTLNLIQNYYNTFNLMHMWPSRCLEAMEDNNRRRWKYW